MITSCDEYPDIIGRDREHGAYLCKSPKQYTLIIEHGDIDTVRHYSRRKVTSDQQAIEKANAVLANLLAESEVACD